MLTPELMPGYLCDVSGPDELTFNWQKIYSLCFNESKFRCAERVVEGCVRRPEER